MIDLAQALDALVQICAPSGYEDQMIAYMRTHFSSYGHTVDVDALGNVIAPVRAPRDGYPHVLIFAHMDEVGFVVRKIEENGFLRLHRLGGIPEKSMAAQPLVFLGQKGPIRGTVATKAHHVTETSEKYQVVTVKDLFVDVGLQSASDVVSAGIRVGTPATWYPAFNRQGSFVQGKSLDNRVGCAILLALAEWGAHWEGPAGLTLVASVQEEFNIRGVVPAVRALQPDLLICLDICIAHDTPDTQEIGDVRLGAGPSIGLYSFHGRGTLNGLIPNPRLVALLERVAEGNGLQTQRHLFFGGLTDVSYAHLTGKGMPAVDIGIPARYTHSPIETCHLDDLAGAVRWLQHFLQGLPSDLDLSRG